MKIWLINHYALTPDQAGGTRHYDIARALVAKGHQVTIIAASIHYSSHHEMKHYPEASTLLQESIDGIDFIWVKTTPYSGNGIGRVRNMLEFTWRLRQLKSLKIPRPDIIVGSSVHLFAVFGAYRLARYFDTPFVMEVRDIWPQTLIDLGVSKHHPFVLLLGWLEPFLYRKADAIITLLPKADAHIEQFGIDRQKIFWVSNGVDLSKFEQPRPTHHLDSEKFNLLYTGTLGKANDLQPLIDAAARLQETPEIMITLVGDGPERQALKEAAKGVKNVTFLKPLPKSELPALLQEADLLFVALKDIPLYRFGMSMNKLFDYMAAQRPTLFATNIDDNPIKTADAGLTVPPDDVDEIVNAVRTVYNATKETQKTMGTNGRTYVERHFSMPVISTLFESALIKAQDNHAKNRPR